MTNDDFHYLYKPLRRDPFKFNGNNNRKCEEELHYRLSVMCSRKDIMNPFIAQ